MTAPLYAIGRFCSRHHYPVIAAWIAVTVALVVLGQSSGRQEQRKPEAARDRLDQGDRTARSNLPEQAYGNNPVVLKATSGKLTESKYAQGVAESVKRLEAIPFVNSAVSPLERAGRGLPQQGRNDRLHPGRPLDRSRGNRRSGRQPCARRGPAGARSRPRYLGRQLRRAAALQALDRDQRGDWPRRGGDHPALRLRHGDGDDAADLLGSRRARLHALDHPPARARRADTGRRRDPGDDDRARGRDRLRAVHRHPPQTPAQRGDGDCGSRSPAPSPPPAAPSSSPASPW